MSKIVSIAEKQIIDSVTSALKANMADGTFIEAEIPPVIVLPTGSENIYTEEQIFTKIIKRFWSCSEERTLYVPTGCTKKYNSAEGWNLMTIKEM